MWTLTGFADEIADDLGEQCSVLTSLGMRHLEFRGAWGTNVAELSDAELDRAGEVLAGAGITVSAVASPVGKSELDVSADVESARLDRCLVVAERLGARYVRVFSFFPGTAAAEGVRDEVVGRLGSLADRARDAGVTLLLENEKDVFGDVPARAADVLAAVDSPSLRAAWDPANFVQVGVRRPFDEGWPLLHARVAYVHVKDALAGDGTVVPAGQGDGQVRELLTALRDEGFDGFFSLEPHLVVAGASGGFSGPDGFRTAHGAFTALLDELGVPYR